MNMSQSRPRGWWIAATGLVFLGLLLWAWQTDAARPSREVGGAPQAFDGERAYEDVLTQMAFGPRVVATEAHTQAVAWMVESLRAAGWTVEVQEAVTAGNPIRNVVAKRGTGQPWTILGAHFDSRRVADQDATPANRATPVPGANDGASGVAVLLELGRVLPAYMDAGQLSGEVWLVLFDAEDNGNLPGSDWILGSRAFVAALAGRPDRVVIVDMIGDADLEIQREQNSDAGLTQEIWDVAARLGYSQFVNQMGPRMLDDHTPFLQAGIPAVDLIDFTYPYWHTLEDTADKVAPASLEAVGQTLLVWLTGG
jgi:hypothetical protein